MTQLLFLQTRSTETSFAWCYHISSHCEKEKCLPTWSSPYCRLHDFSTLKMVFLSWKCTCTCTTFFSFTPNQLKHHLPSLSMTFQVILTKKSVCQHEFHVTAAFMIFSHWKCYSWAELHTLVTHSATAFPSKQINLNILCLNIYHISSHSWRRNLCVSMKLMQPSWLLYV